jgi:hypothetical protein
MAELAKMLSLVAPSSMTADQQTVWLASAVDALEDIRADEVRHVSAEVRRSITRHNQIVPEIAKLVAERRAAKSRANVVLPPLPPTPERKPAPPMTTAEIGRMPRWLRDMGLRVGFLKRENGQIVDAHQ